MRFGKVSIGNPKAYFDLSKKEFKEKFEPHMGRDLEKGWEFIQSEKKKNGYRKNKTSQVSKESSEPKEEGEHNLVKGGRRSRRKKSDNPS